MYSATYVRRTRKVCLGSSSEENGNIYFQWHSWGTRIFMTRVMTVESQEKISPYKEMQLSRTQYFHTATRTNTLIRHVTTFIERKWHRGIPETFHRICMIVAKLQDNQPVNKKSK